LAKQEVNFREPLMTDSFLQLAPMGELDTIRIVDTRRSIKFDRASAQTEIDLPENVFHSMLTLERRRAERSRKPFALMLLDANLENGPTSGILKEAAGIIAAAKREIDLIGWYKDNDILGVIFTEIETEGDRPVTEILGAKIETALAKHLGGEKAGKIAISLHIFPETRDEKHSGWVADAKFYPDLNHRISPKRLPLVVKRAMDIVVSAAFLLVLSPLLAAIAAMIKLTSKGPVIFNQERLGRFGVPFKCLKFRTMFANNDPRIHEEYIQQFISGAEECGKEGGSQQPIYKILNDPRVTPFGRFLRKTSLDELPQFWNVLRGEMSLVGPRPPLQYEFEIYDIWHRRRVLDVKPGVTGLWQVTGRSRTRFDDMVRLDLRYCQTWSMWLDLKILLSTPRAVFGGEGAY
jgi:lipopolysaccharide/colanic/teichoic acid biosynthesis glycosyltransferase